MKKVFMGSILTTICVIILLLSSCSYHEPNTLTVEFAKGVELVLEEREFPASELAAWEEQGKKIEIAGVQYEPIETFYVYSFPAQHLCISKVKPEKESVLVADGAVVSANFGHYGGGTYYVKDQFEGDSYLGWAYEEIIAPGVGVVNYSHQGLAYGLFSAKGVLHEPYCTYMFTGNAVYRLWHEKREDADEVGPQSYQFRHEKIYGVSGAEGAITAGICYDDAIYLAMEKGFFRLENGKLISLSAQTSEFWRAAYVSSIATFDEKIYIAMASFGIYEYDPATGEERLYTHTKNPALLWEVRESSSS